jgi:translation elongation factor P/translation initiation factor 5A
MPGRKKSYVEGLDLFNNKKYEDSMPSEFNVEIPKVDMNFWQVLSCDDEGFLTLFNDKGEKREDMKIPKDNETISSMIENRLNSGQDVFILVMSVNEVQESKIVEAYEINPNDIVKE